VTNSKLITHPNKPSGQSPRTWGGLIDGFNKELQKTEYMLNSRIMKAYFKVYNNLLEFIMADIKMSTSLLQLQ